jgi:hypothetical protein
MLVKGDLIQLALGEIAPAQIKWVPLAQPGVHLNKSMPKPTKHDLTLERGALFKPSAFGQSEDTLIPPGSQFYFRVQESPVHSALEAALTTSRPETVIHTQLRILEHFFAYKIIWVIFLVSFLVNLGRYLGLLYSYPFKTATMTKEQGFELLVVLQLYALLPLLPMVLPSFLLVARSFGNAQILALYDGLQASQTEFEDREDVDEFDVAPPPTKNLIVDRGISFFLKKWKLRD